MCLGVASGQGLFVNKLSCGAATSWAGSSGRQRCNSARRAVLMPSCLHCKDAPVLLKNHTDCPAPQGLQLTSCGFCIFMAFSVCFLKYILNAPNCIARVSWGHLSLPALCPQQKGDTLGVWGTGGLQGEDAWLQCYQDAVPCHPSRASVGSPEALSWTRLSQHGCGISICTPYLNDASSFGSPTFSPCWKPSAGVADRRFTFPET